MNTFDEIKAILKKDAFVAHCGIELLSVGPGTASARLTVLPHHLNSIGIVQGGAIFTLADFAFAAASNSHGTVAVGIQVSISYLKAVTTGTLVAEAIESSRNSKLGTYTVQVRNEAGELIALFQGMVYRKEESLPTISAA